MLRHALCLWGGLVLSLCAALPAQAGMDNYPMARLRMLDKVTARTSTFDVAVGSTVRFGQLYIKPRACRKSPPIEPPESAAFLQIWEVKPKMQPQWAFSGWMFSSSPALSAMDHPIYDVWVLDCPGAPPPDPTAANSITFNSAGIVYSSSSVGFSSAGHVEFTSMNVNAAPGIEFNSTATGINFSSSIINTPPAPTEAPPEEEPPPADDNGAASDDDNQTENTSDWNKAYVPPQPSATPQLTGPSPPSPPPETDPTHEPVY